MTLTTDSPTTLPAGMGLRYGLLGLPLAFVALPLYVHLPNMYASRYGMPLATLGVVLLLARLFDGVTDPWLGRLGDQLFRRSPHHVIGAGVVAALLLVLSMGLLFFPPWANPGNPLVLMVMLMLTSLAYSLLAGLITERGDRGQREGAYFGWWNLASKLNLALAAGLTLPLLDLLGYRPGTTSPEGLQALTLAYAVLPCALKLLAASGLYLAFIRANSSSHCTLAELP